MNKDIEQLINQAVANIIDRASSKKKIQNLLKRHDAKLHFIPRKYRVFGGLLQSMNIQFGNFVEELMRVLVENDGRYEIVEAYSGKKQNTFNLSAANDRLIDEYITKCQSITDFDTSVEFPRLLAAIRQDKDTNTSTFKHDIDLLFRDKTTGRMYYMEIKYNDDHDTGKFVDINRKFIKTYAYLVKELNLTTADELTPILFFFTNKRLKGNIYLPEVDNIRRGRKFFEDFLSVAYDDVDGYLKTLSESDEIITMFDELYRKVMASAQQTALGGVAGSV